VIGRVHLLEEESDPPTATDAAQQDQRVHNKTLLEFGSKFALRQGSGHFKSSFHLFFLRLGMFACNGFLPVLF